MGLSTSNAPVSTPLVAVPQMALEPQATEDISGLQSSSYVIQADTRLTPEQESDDSSDIDFYCGVVASEARRKASVVPTRKPSLEPLWLSKGRSYIANHQIGLDVPFAKASDTILRRLDEVEKTKGGPKRILTKLMKLAHEVLVYETARLFDSDAGALDNKANPGDIDYSDDDISHNVLECSRCVMVLQARVQKQSTAIGHISDSALAAPNGAPAARTRELSVTPIGGVLIVNGPPNENIPPKSALHIKDYSNSVYWQYAPYLDTVRLAPGLEDE